MAKPKKTLEELLEEALSNVQEDRERILAAHDKLKVALDASNVEQTAIMGATAVKVLEQLTKANEQIVRLAQIKEREESRKKGENDDDDTIFDVEEINRKYDKEKEEN